MVEYRVNTRQTIDTDSILPDDLLASHLVLADIETELLIVYKESAIAEAERYCNRAILKSEITISADRSNFRLPYGARQVLSVLDSTGTEITYTLNPVTYQMTLQGAPVYPVFITAVAGYEYEEVPKDLRHAMLMMIATAYENRESIANGYSTAEIPYSHKRILDLYRLPNGG